MKKESTAPDTATLLEFLFRLGQAYIACGEQTAKVELTLRRTASAYGMRKSRVVAFPTALFISIHDEAGERVTLAQCEPQTLRLDQIGGIYALGEAAQKAEVAPGEGLQRLSAILAQKARFGAAGIVVGHTILTVGLAIVLMPTAANLAAAAGLGFIVGAVKLTQRGQPVQAVPLPVIAAANCLRARFPRSEAWAAGGSPARAGAAADHLPAGRHAGTRHGGARLRRHGERRKPPDRRLRETGAAGVRSRGGRRSSATAPTT
jgi:uncharacterized membrane protein YjjP (DUF1212 family)